MFISIILSIFFVSFAQDCQCPVTKCDPCQKAVLLGSQKLSCGRSKNLMCNNMVCENVANYSQCVKGDLPDYIPVEDVMTELAGKDWDRQMRESLDSYSHYDHHIDVKVSAEESPEIGIRRLAQVGEVSKKEVSADEDMDNKYPLVLKGASQITFDGRSRKSANSVMTFKEASGEIHFLIKQNIALSFNGAVATLKVHKGTSLRFEKEGDYLSLHPKAGSFSLSGISTKNVLIVDVGQWRFGKKKGALSVEIKGKDIVVKNTADKALLRQDQIIAKSELVDTGTEFLVSHDFGIVYADKAEEQPQKKWTLPETKKIQRVLASSPIDQEGCTDPRGTSDQCAWKCFGAKGKACESTETTQCVRFMCSLGGEWKQPTRVSGKECKADQVVVDTCH